MAYVQAVAYYAYRSTYDVFSIIYGKNAFRLPLTGKTQRRSDRLQA